MKIKTLTYFIPIVFENSGFYEREKPGKAKHSRYNSLHLNQKGVSLVSVMVGMGVASILGVIVLQLVDFQVKSPALSRSQNSETQFRQILRLMDNEACEETFSGVSIGGSVTQIKDKNGRVVFDIADQTASENFEVVKIDTGQFFDEDTKTPTAIRGKATMTFYSKRKGTFIDQQSTGDCSASDTSGCFSDRCSLGLEQTNTGVTGTSIGKCQPVSCGGGGSLKEAPDCYRVTDQSENPSSQTLIGCGTTLDNKTSETVAYGFNAGSGASRGSGNTFIGYSAGEENIDGSENIFVGYEAGKENTRGGKNIFIGYQAGSSNTEGSNNVFIGSGAGSSNTTGNNQIFMKGGVASISLKNTSSINMLDGGEIDASIIKLKYNLTELTATGNKLHWLTGGSNAGSIVIDNNITFNSSLTTTPDCVKLSGGDICVGHFDSVKMTRLIRLYISGLHSHGTLFAASGHSETPCVNIFCPPCPPPCVNCPPPPPPPLRSDRNLKKEIKPLYGKESLDQITELKPVSFYWKDKEFPLGEHLGFIAQDVRTTIPQLVNENQNHDHDPLGEAFLSLNYVGLIPVIVSALKSFLKTVEEYGSQLKDLYGKAESNREELENNNSRFSKTELELLNLSNEMKNMENENRLLKEQILKMEASIE